MFGSIMSGLIDTVGIVTGKIQDTLADLAEELKEKNHQNFFLTIKPSDSEDYNFICEVWHRKQTGIEFVREISIKEIVDK